MAEGYFYPGQAAAGALGGDPQSMKSRLAASLLAAGTDTSPIKSPWQGAARLSQALVGSLMMNRMTANDPQAKQVMLQPPPIPGYGGGYPGAPAGVAPAPGGGFHSQIGGAPAYADSNLGGAPTPPPRPPGLGVPPAGPGNQNAGLPPALAQPNGQAGGAPPGTIIGGQGMADSGQPSTAQILASALAASEANGGSAIPPGSIQTASLDGNAGFQALADKQPYYAGTGPRADASPYYAGTGPAATQAGGFSPQFQQADAVTARFEGGKTRNDGNGGTAAYGIDQNAHPGINVMDLTPQGAQGIRHGYWQAIGGDQIAAVNPQLAQVAYDTAIMSGPQKALAILNQSGGDPMAYLQMRDQFLANLAQNPKYAGAAQGWATRDNQLGSILGNRPVMSGGQPTGIAPGQLPTAGTQPNNSAGLDPSMMFSGPGARGAPPPQVPPAGGGGDLMSQLGNWFNPNPSAPQGGNAQTSAAGGQGAPQGQMQAYIRQLMAISMDENTSPYIRNQAAQMAQTYMAYSLPHPTTWETMPGTNDIAERDWLGNFTGRRVAGPAKYEKLAPGETAVPLPGTGGAGGAAGVLGDPNAGIKYAADKAAAEERAKMAAQNPPLPPLPGAPQSQQQPQTGPSPYAPSDLTPSAPAAPQPQQQPGAPRSPLTDVTIPPEQQGDAQLDAFARANPQMQTAVNLAKAILHGNAPMPTGNAGEKPWEVQARQLVQQVNPQFNAGIYAQRQKALTDFNDGTTPNSAGGMITNANAAIGHLADLARKSEALGKFQGNSWPLYNMARGYVADKTGGDYANARADFHAAVTPFAGELTKFFTGSEGDAATRKAYDEMVDENATPDSRRHALNTLSDFLETKINVLSERFKNATGGDMPYPVELQQARDGLKFVRGLMGGQQQPQEQQAQPSAPARINSQAEYDALPSGKQYIGPDGTVRSKR